MHRLNNKGIATTTLVIIIVVIIVVLGGAIGGVLGYNAYQDKKSQEDTIATQESENSTDNRAQSELNNATQQDQNAAINTAGDQIKIKYTDLLTITYGELKALYGNNLPTELHFHGEYYVTVPQLGVDFVFCSSNTVEPQLKDTDLVTKISGRLGEVVTGLNGTMTVEEFTNKLVSVRDPATYEMKEGAGTSYYISDYYAEVHFTDEYPNITEEDRENGISGLWGGSLFIAANTDNTIDPDSWVWIEHVAG